MKRHLNLKSMLENTARRCAEKTAIIMGDRRLTFAELDADSNRVARALIKMGVKKGDRVAMIQPSDPEFVTVFFGIVKIGAIAVPLDSRYVATELSSILGDCQPEVLFITDPSLQNLAAALPSFYSGRVVKVGDAGGDPSEYQRVLASNPPAPLRDEIAPEDIAVISYTGGPTSRPHGVALSHRSIYIEAANSAQVFEQTEHDIMIQFALPLYHQFGLTAVLLASVYRGNPVVMVPGTGRSIDRFLQTIARERGTIYMGVPYIYALMINLARREGLRHDLSSLRLWISGGAPLEPEIITLFEKYYGRRILDIYGQTESVSQITVSPINGTGEKGASGKPMPCWEIKIFDEDDHELPRGSEGEIVARGPMMTGFYNKPEATARALRHGWLHTGDIGRIDKDGFLYITGRKRRMLILKGQNIFPEDIETVLFGHPKIEEVRVIGVPDIVRGETVRALVRLKPGVSATPQEIRQYCQGRMADYKLPREIVFVEEMPADLPLWKRRSPTEAETVNLEIAD